MAMTTISIERFCLRLCRSRALALVCIATLPASCDAAWAFERTTQGQAEVSQLSKLQGIEISPSSNARGAGLELTLPSSSISGGSTSDGTGLAIPGLSNMPKLDFGLELLYGTPDQSSPTNDQSDALPNALTVHGAVKKTF
jgi:hypothetical protein